MSWLFGSSKKKEPPQVTVDPNPIDGFLVVQTAQSADNSHSLYPSLNNGGYPLVPSSLPYSPKPSVPNSIHSTSPSTSTTTPLGSSGNEIHNLLESVPFRIASQLQLDTSNGSNNSVVNESIEKLTKLKRCFKNGEFDYDFKLERNILREAKMMNGHSVY